MKQAEFAGIFLVAPDREMNKLKYFIYPKIKDSEKFSIVIFPDSGWEIKLVVRMIFKITEGPRMKQVSYETKWSDLGTAEFGQRIFMNANRQQIKHKSQIKLNIVVYCLTKISIRAKHSISRVFSLFIVPSPFFVHCPHKGRINRAKGVLTTIYGFCHCF